ncbi:MAG: class I SAM-dependent methyltransferase [Treponema sp.]|jgi:SAM-dependent methyltransferase|nr:class I SAM-dependent methyltransferase [Treponema sp.]
MAGSAEGIKTWSTPAAAEAKREIPCAVCGGRSFKPALSCGSFAYVRCTGCGLAQMNPQPLPEEVRRRYGAAHGTDYLAYEISNEAAFLRLQEMALEDAGFYAWEQTLCFDGSARPALLDIGCATGALLERLWERGWDARGVELSPQEAEYARRERGLDVSALPLEEKRFPAAFFTAALASHLIEHLNDPASLVREVWRILIPGGRFWVTTPNIGGFQARLFGSRWRSAIFDHLYLFSAKTLRVLLEGTGFRVERMATWGGLAAGTAPGPVKRAADRAAKRFGFGDVMIFQAVKEPVCVSNA